MPKQFDDPLKRSCAHAERKWAMAAGGMGAGAATTTAAVASGLALPPLIPFLLAGAAICGLFKTSAQWGKEDPPRDDYDLPVRLPERRVDLQQLEALDPRTTLGYHFLGSAPPPLLLVARVEEAGLRLGATVEAVEKSLGAIESGDESDEALAAIRFYEARVHAFLTSYVLRSVGMASRVTQEAAKAWFPDESEMVLISTLWDAMDPELAGQLLAAGVDPALFEISLDDSMPEALDQLPQILDEAGESAIELAAHLEIWASRDDEGSDPAKMDEVPLVPSQGPSSEVKVDLFHELFGPTARKRDRIEVVTEEMRTEIA